VSATVELAAHRFGRIAHARDGVLERPAGDAQLFGPVLNLPLFLQTDPRTVRRPFLGEVIGHSLLSTGSTPCGKQTASADRSSEFGRPAGGARHCKASPSRSGDRLVGDPTDY